MGRKSPFWSQWSPVLREIVAATKRPDGATDWAAVSVAFKAASGRAVSGKVLQEQHKYDLVSGWHERPAAPDPVPGEAPAIQHISDVLDLPVRPFEVPRYQHRAADMTGKVRTAIVYSDTHFPSQDEATLAVLMRTIEGLQPDVVIHLGDLLDCYTISRYSKDPTRLTTLQDEIDAARLHLAQVRDLAPQAECWLLEGNHEARLTKTIWELPGGGQELARLTAFRAAMTWPHLLQLNDIAWSWVPSGEQSRKSILPKLITKHGDVVRKWSSWTAKGEWERYGRGGLSGHTHRLGSFYHRDHNGAHQWIETGCTCRIDPEYVRDPDWQAGFVIVRYTEERYAAELVYVQDGTAIVAGREVAA